MIIGICGRALITYDVDKPRSVYMLRENHDHTAFMSQTVPAQTCLAGEMLRASPFDGSDDAHCGGATRFDRAPKHSNLERWPFHSKGISTVAPVHKETISMISNWTIRSTVLARFPRIVE